MSRCRLTHPSEGRSHITEGLTERQQEIFDRLKRNMKPAEIAEDLGISRNAVYQHVTSLKRAGALEDQRQAAALSGDVFATAASVVARAEARIAEITEHEARLKAEREQLTEFVKRNRDLIPA